MCCSLYQEHCCVPTACPHLYTHTFPWDTSTHPKIIGWSSFASEGHPQHSHECPRDRWGEPALGFMSPSTSHHSCCHTILWSSDFLSWLLSRLHLWETLIFLWHGQDKIFLKHWKFLFLLSPRSNSWWEHTIHSIKWRAALGSPLSSCQNEVHPDHLQSSRFVRKELAVYLFRIFLSKLNSPI